jgi:hypothetical protein
LPIDDFDFATTVVVPTEVFGTIVQQSDIEGSPHFSVMCLQHSCSAAFIDAETEGTAQRMVGVSRERNRTSVKAACTQRRAPVFLFTGLLSLGL